jgi:hypothetical protein
MTRRAIVALLPSSLLAQSAESARPARFELSLVQDFVGKAHQRAIPPMKELLEREPGLIYASWDWGGGDWENALQAAAHTGSRDMALFLLESGARLDIFAAAMLGDLELLKSASKTSNTLRAKGAHGIPLLSHAVAGEERAKTTVLFLLDQGADVNARHNNGMTALMVAAQTGQTETVKLLLSKGADPKFKAKNGTTALALSLKRNREDIAEDLRKAGATE